MNSFLKAQALDWHKDKVPQIVVPDYLNGNKPSKDLDPNLPIDCYNIHHGPIEVVTMLQKNGYELKYGTVMGGKPASCLIAPSSSTRQPGVRVFTGNDGNALVLSYHGTQDAIARFGVSRNGKHKVLDAFGAMCAVEYNGDQKVAVREWAKQMPKPEISIDFEKIRANSMSQQQTDQRAEQKPEKPNFKLTIIDELRNSLKPTEWLLELLIEDKTINLMYGDPAAGKSLLAIDAACCIAAGRDWHGHDVKQGCVVYLAGEGHAGIMRRIVAWETEHGALPKCCPLFVSECGAGLLEKQSTDDVGQAVNDIASTYGQPVLLVIDTLHRNFGGGDENNSSDFGKFLGHVEQFRNYFGCAILIVHHSGHGDKDRSRGSSSIRASMDGEYKIQKNDDLITLSNQKMKDSEPPPDTTFKITPKELPGLVDHHGQPVTSVTVVATDERPEKGRSRPLAGQKKAALEILIATMQKDGEFIPSSAKGKKSPWDEVPLDGYRAVTYSQWRKAFDSATPSESDDELKVQDAKRKALKRASASLQDLKAVVIWDDFVRLNFECPDSACRVILDAELGRQAAESIKLHSIKCA